MNDKGYQKLFHYLTSKKCLTQSSSNEIYSDDVVESFKNFLLIYDSFRIKYGLNKKKIKNIYEILTGMADKQGRICRYIKHQERKDPKSDWPEGMVSAMTGMIVYMIMILDYYHLDISEGMKKELDEAIKQYAK